MTGEFYLWKLVGKVLRFRVFGRYRFMVSDLGLTAMHSF